MTYTAARNSPFQSLASDGCKLAMWELLKAGYRLVGFVHDEFIMKLSVLDDCTAHAKRIEQICIDAMQTLVGDIPVKCEYALARRWYKQAEAVFDSNGELQLWEPDMKAVTKDRIATPTTTEGKKENKKRPATAKSVLKWHGGNSKLADWIIDNMPTHLHYVEPFFGAGHVLFRRDHTRNWYATNGEKLPAKFKGCSEVVNDIDENLMNFWRVLQSPEQFELLRRRLDVTPFAATEFAEANEPSDDPIERAAQLFIRVRQSRTGLQRDFATLTQNRTRRNMNEQASAWWSAIEGLADAVKRLRGVVILNDDACKVMCAQDSPKILFYCDPPYVPSTRTVPDCYQHDMTPEDHVRFLECVLQLQGKVMISGYPSDMYDKHLNAWRFVDKVTDKKSSGAKTKPKATERLWMNY